MYVARKRFVNSAFRLTVGAVADLMQIPRKALQAAENRDR